jgi:hypothetical protein
LHRRNPSFEECAQNPTYLLDVRVAPRLARQNPNLAALGNLDVSWIDQALVSTRGRIFCKRPADPLGDRNRLVPIHRNAVLEQLGDREGGRTCFGFRNGRNDRWHR